MARALAIEAEPELRSLICLILTDDGHECLELDPEAPQSSCLDAIRSLRPDVLVVGVASPVGQREVTAGLRCLEELDSAGESLPTVVYSLSADQTLAGTLQKRGYVVWRRPFENIEELSRLIAEALKAGDQGKADDRPRPDSTAG